MLYQRILKFLLLFFCFGSTSSKAQQYSMRNFPSTVVGHSQVYALLEDSRGTIWIGTWGGGLSTYDGQEFRIFTEKEGLLSIYISALYEDRNGDIWIGSDKGLSKFDGRTFQHFSLIRDQEIPIRSIAQDRKGALWIGTPQGLFRYQDEQFLDWSNRSAIPPNLSVNALYQDSKDCLWVGSNQGAYCIQETRVKKYTKEDGLTSNTIQSITEDADGRIWMATIASGITILDGENLSRFEYSDLLEDGLGVNFIFRDDQNRIWVGLVNQGAYIWNPKDSSSTFLRERNQDGLESNNIKAMIQDSWGDYWLGTSGGGLSKYFYSDQQFTNYTEKDGLVDREIYALCQDSSKRLWLATSRGIAIYDGKGFVNYSRDNGFMDVKSRAIFADRSGKIWIGTEGQGLAAYDGISYRFFKSWDGLGGDLIQDIEQDHLGNIWVAMADAGIARLALDPLDSLGNTYRIKRFGRSDGLPDSYIYDLHIDQQQRIWYASRRGGIGYIQNDTTLINFSLADGLPALEVRTLHEDRLGNLWGGTARSGIFKLNIYRDSIQIQTFDQSDGLSSNNIYLLTFDHNDQFWIGHQTGVDQVQLNAGNNEILQVNTFRAKEGFLGGETCESAVLADSSGNVWFGTIGGLSHYQPQSEQKNQTAPKLRFTNIRLSYDSLKNTSYASYLNNWGGLKNDLVLPYHQNQLAFEFQGINLPAPQKVSYSWILEGLNEEWSPPQATNNVNYANLAPNTYTFKVKAFNEDQVVVDQAIELQFTIDPPIWETWWFRLTVISVSVLFLLSLLAAWIRRIRRKDREQAERLEMEKNVLELEQKALQLQMNPHFIFNALNTIQSMINEKDHRNARYQLAKFSKLMRSTLEHSRSTFIPLEEEIQALENYLSIEQLSRNNSFDFTIQTIGDTDAESLLVPPMMIQPFVENAIIHGVAHISDQGLIEIQFTRRNGFLECMVQDNGIGRKKAAALKSQIEHQHKSTALQVTQERLAILNHQNKDQLKYLEMIDRLSESGAIQGTKIILRLPLAEG